MTEPRVLMHLVGSPVDEFHAELSRLYAAGCLRALDDPARYRHEIAYVAPGGSWRFPRDLSPAELCASEPLTPDRAVGEISALAPEVMIPQMFCRPGMTTYRALFDLLGIPHLGNAAEVMAIAADKSQTRAIVAAAGVAVPTARVVRDARAPEGLRWPVVVKPVGADNSAGVTLVREPGQYPGAVAAALAHGGAALVETYIELGREVRCGMVVRDGAVTGLPLEEYAVDAVDKPIRDARDKLARTADGELYLVAKDDTRAWIVPDDDPLTERVHAAARRAHLALGCRHYSLFDFRIDPEGTPWFLEAGLYCSFSASSVIAAMAAAAGIPVAELFARTLAELDRERTAA